jgi:hypothetical protein
MDDNLEIVSFAISAAGRSYGKFPMVFEHIDKLKREYTDKYVVVDNSRPELRRFDGQTGLVRTVNMNGRALVEFDAYENIGWYDIDIDFLKIIDKPLPKPEPNEQPAKKPAAKKPAAKKAESKKAPAAGGMSVEEMLAAARGDKAGAATKPAPAAKAESPAAPKAAPGGAGMSLEDILAAARGEKSAAPAAAPETHVEPAPEPAAEPEAAEPPAAEPDAPTPRGELPTDTAGMLDYCRKTDGS